MLYRILFKRIMKKRKEVKYNVRPVMGLSLFCLALLLACSSAKDAQRYEIKKGEFIAALNETGDLEAVKSRVITIPFIGWKYGSSMNIIGLLDHGAQVSLGDSVAQIDESGVMKFLMEKQNRLEVERANLKKLLAQHRSRLKGLETELASAEASLNLNKIQLEKYKFESERKRKIKELEYERQMIQFNKTRKNYRLTRTILENELKIQELKIFRLENDIEDAYNALSQLTIRSPLNGIMQLLESRRSRQMVKIGDELYQGQRFACIPDLSQMKVKSTVNETDIGKIGLGQRAEVRLDAFPSIPFEGEIIEIGRLSYKKDEKSRTKVFDIVILLNESDPILKPGMTVRCEIFTAQLEDVYYVGSDCIIRENGKYYIVIQERGNNEKCEVKMGPRNNKFTVIYGDFREGQRVLPLSEIDEENLVKVGL